MQPKAPDRPTLAALLERARGHKMTPAEIDAQRRSWVRAEAGFGSDADEAAYHAAVAAGDKKEITWLDAEAEERIRRVNKIMDDSDV